MDAIHCCHCGRSPVVMLLCLSCIAIKTSMRLERTREHRVVTRNVRYREKHIDSINIVICDCGTVRFKNKYTVPVAKETAVSLDTIIVPISPFWIGREATAIQHLHYFCACSASAAGLLTIRITESPLKNILLTYRSLLMAIPRVFPFPPLDCSVHISLTSSNNLLI